MMKMHYLRHCLSLALFLILPLSCHRVPETIEPHLNYTIQDKYLLSLPSAFPPLTAEELTQDFGKEMHIGLVFAQKLELYQAITAFKRAAILIPTHCQARALELQYEILLCYYLGKKWNDVIETFEMGPLRFVDHSFPGLHDLLLILYDTYLEEKRDLKAAQMLQLIQHYFPEEKEKLELSEALIEANLPQIETIAATPPSRPYLDHFLHTYATQKKSVTKAQLFNACLPGAGYLYLGQRQSAITAFLLNGLFIASSVYCFEHGNIAAGILCTGFEAGWYFGGIFGAGLEAKAYNERLYEQLTTPMMNRERLFPVLMLHYAF